MFKCKECGKAYNARGSLSHHRKTHLKEKEQKQQVVSAGNLLQQQGAGLSAAGAGLSAAGANQLLQEAATAAMMPLQGAQGHGQVPAQHGLPAVSGIRMPPPGPEQPVFQHVQHLGYTGMLMN